MSERTLVGGSGLLCCLLLSGTASAAPDLYRHNGGRSDRAGAAVIDAAGNVYVAGYSERTDGQSSFAVVKRTPQGNVD